MSAIIKTGNDPETIGTEDQPANRKTNFTGGFNSRVC
jgi:hypothetical protein